MVVQVQTVRRASVAAIVVACTAAVLLGIGPRAALAAGGWVVQAGPPQAAPDQALLGISCPSQTWCMSVGSSIGYCGEAAGVCAHYGNAFSEAWDGATWAPVAVAGAGPGEDLVAVSCPSQSACLAVGWQHVHKGTQALIERWDGTGWAVLPVPAGLAGSTLASVSCAAADACMAVGSRAGARGASRSLAVRWNGHRLIVRTAPGSGLSAVSCPGTSSCYAAGQGLVHKGCGGPVIEHWTPGRWRVLYRIDTGCSTDGYGAYAGSIAAVSCPANGFCVGVGSECCSEVAPYAFAVQWTPRRASAIVPALPGRYYASGNGDVLLGVTCSSPIACTAVGASDGGDGDPTPLPGTFVARYNGRHWRYVPSPTPGGLGGNLAAVACPGPSGCLAVGSYQGSAVSPLIESNILGGGV